MKLLLLLASLILVNPVHKKVTVTTVEQNTITIKGTSNVHDWVMTSTEINATGQIIISDSEIIIDSFKGVIPTESLKSYSKQMDINAYKTLKSEIFSKIEFEFLKLTGQNKEKQEVKAFFSVTVSGVTKQTEVLASITPCSDDAVQIKGVHAIKMTDFGIKPPSFMLGAIKVGDDLQIEFDLNVKITNNESFAKKLN